MIATFFTHSTYLTLHHLRRLWRQPWYIAITLIQPVIWLLIFGQLFKRIVEIPGFNTSSYIDFLTPGVVIMTALFSSGWSGMGTIEAIDRGVLDRFLVTPISRAALIVGPLLQNGIVIMIQSVIIVSLGAAVGAKFNGIAGVLVLIVCAALLGAALSALSHGLALLARKEETLIAAVNLFVTPLSFLSSSFMQRDLTPGWIQVAASYNPVTWAVEAARSALSTDPSWSFVFVRIASLLGVALVCGMFATRAFRVYQRSV